MTSPYLAGSNTAASGTSLIVTAGSNAGGAGTASGLNAGDTAVLALGLSGSTTSTGGTDSNSETFTAGAAETASPGSALWCYLRSAGLASGTGTATASFSASGGAKNAALIGVPGAGGADSAAAAAATGTGPSVSLTSGALTGDGEPVIGVVTYGSTGGSTFTWGSGWTPLGIPFRTATDQWTAVAYATGGTAGSTVTLTGTTGAGTPTWTAAIQPFALAVTAAAKQAPVPVQSASMKVAVPFSASQAVVPVQSASMKLGLKMAAAQQVPPLLQSASLSVTGPPPPSFPQAPIGLTAQMLLASSQVTGTPGPTGATVSAATYGYTQTQIMTAAAKFDGYTSTSLAARAQRWYETEGQLPTSVPAGLAQLITAGVFVQLCVKPNRSAVVAGGSTLTAEQGALATFLTAVANACIAAGFPGNFDCTLWTEFNDKNAGYFPDGGLTFAAYWAAYAGVITGLGIPLNYNPATNGVSYANAVNWFAACMAAVPADQWLCDWYCNGFTAGIFPDQTPSGLSANYMELADGAGLPFGIAEYGLASGAPAMVPTSGEWAAFITYLQDLFTARLQQGKTNAEIIQYATAAASTDNVITGPTDFKTGLTSIGGVPIPGSYQMAALSQPISAAGAEWEDFSGYLYQREGTSPAVTITRGRPNESAQATPASATAQINNQAGNFTAENPGGAWYGQLGRNTPVRFSVPGQNPYLRLEDDNSSCASCPDASPLDITGSIDIRVDVTLSSYVGCVLACKWTPGVGETENSWLLQLNDDGTLTLFWSQAGTDLQSAQSTLPIPAYGRVMIRALVIAASGEVSFWTGATMSSSFSQLGATVGPGTTTEIYNSDAPVAVGNYGPAYLNPVGVFGSVHEFRLYSGDAGTLVADPVFTGQVPGAPSFADGQGNTWTLYGTAEISQRSYRYHGEMSSSPKQTDPSLTDVYVPLTSGGILRRLQQGNAPEYSPMRRALQAQAGTLACVAYWPCEDLQGSTVIGSATGGLAMTVSGGTGDGEVTFTGPAFASDTTFVCSGALPVCNGSAWHGVVPAYESNGSLIVRFLLNQEDAGTGNMRIMRVITTGTCQEWALYYGASGSGQIGIAGYNASGTVFDSGLYAFGIDSTPMWVSMELRPGSGSTVDWSVATLKPGASSGNGVSGTFTGTIGNATDVYANPQYLMEQTTIGHISIQSAWESLFALYWPLDAWTGETAGNRFNRLCGENNIAARIYGPPSLTSAMGAQPVDTLPDLLQQCEDADRGQIYEPRQSYALGYRILVSLLNQQAAVTLDWSQKMLAAGKWQAPTDDDQYTINDVTATRESGGSSGSSGASYRTYLDDGSAMSISPPPAGVGDYATTASLNVEADAQLPDLAGWIVHCGTVDEPRWPAIPVDLSRTETAALFWALQEINIGDCIEQINLPPWISYDDVRQLAAGVTEEIGGFIWRLTWNGIPESPYETGVYNDPVYGRADTGGASLEAGISTTETTFAVATASGPLWTTAAADFPFDISIRPPGAAGKGERVTVTNITGTSSPQTFTVTRSVNGVVMAHNAGEQVELFTTPVYAIA